MCLSAQPHGFAACLSNTNIIRCKFTKKDKHTFTFFKQDDKKNKTHVYLNNNKAKIKAIFCATKPKIAYICIHKEISTKRT